MHLALLLPPAQELKVFLETPGELGSNMRWTGMMPASASVLEGTAKFSMQLIGRESKVGGAWREQGLGRGGLRRAKLNGLGGWQLFV